MKFNGKIHRNKIHLINTILLFLVTLLNKIKKFILAYRSYIFKGTDRIFKTNIKISASFLFQ